MKKLDCIIVDDEPLAREGLKKYVEQINFLQLKATCKNAMQANTVLKEQAIDLLFLDIEMPLLTGIELLKSQTKTPFVVFTTAYPKYALEGYQFDVIDYLLKPISFERFLHTCNKALRLIPNKKQASQQQEPFIFVKTDKQLLKLNIKNILYIEAMQNYIIFHTQTGQVTTLVPMKNIFDLLSKEAFLQIHKSYIVAKNKVEVIEGNELIINQQKLPISTRMRKEVLKALTESRLLKK